MWPFKKKLTQDEIFRNLEEAKDHLEKCKNFLSAKYIDKFDSLELRQEHLELVLYYVIAARQNLRRVGDKRLRYQIDNLEYLTKNFKEADTLDQVRYYLRETRKLVDEILSTLNIKLKAE